MVGHDVHHQAQAVCVGIGNEAIEVLERAVLAVDVDVVGDVVSVIEAGTGVEGCDPDRIDAEVGEIR